MVFSVVMENTKVVANLFIYLVLKFHDTRPYGLGVMNFRSLLLGFAYALNRSECLVCLTNVHMESCLGDNRRSVLLFLSFPKCLIALILVV
jgi:TctA family transporter